jgi:hypothetical protein
MILKINQTMNNNLEKFAAFLESVKKDASDLAVVQSGDSAISTLLGNKSKKFFRIYYRSKAGDLVGEWDINGDFKSKSLPIVWLSSEGSPYSVVANDDNEFLSLIPFGIGLMNRIPALIKDYERKPDIFVSPDEEFNKEVIQEEYDYQAKQFEGHQQMVDFIMGELKISLSKDPLQTIKSAINSFPDLDEWIGKNLKE